MQDRTCLALLIVLIATIPISALVVTLIVYLASGTFWSRITILLFTLTPIGFALWTIGRVIAQSWRDFLYPSDMVRLSKEDEDSQEEWVFVSLWMSYAKDLGAGPLQFHRASPNFAIHVVITLLFAGLVVLNIVIMARHFSWIYLLSSLVTWVSFPFLIRFNVFKIFRKPNYEHHPKFLKCGRILLAVHGVFFAFSLIVIMTAIVSAPKRNAKHDFISSGTVPVINLSWASEMPTVCSTQFHSLSILQYAGIAEAPHDASCGEQFFMNKLTLMLGGNWSETFEVIRTVTTPFAVFQHIRSHTENLDIIAIAGKDPLSDNLLVSSIATLYWIPEEIFSKLPFAELFYAGMLEVIISWLNVLADLYSPRRLMSAYSDPLKEYIQGILAPDKRLLLVGSAAGGAVAKVLGVHFSIQAIVYNSPEMRFWLMDNLSKPSTALSVVRNVLIMGQTNAGSETGAMVEYIPFDHFPMNPASSSAVICTLAIQCRVSEHFQSFCEQSLPADTLKKIEDGSPYH
jgi:hypothetical protein